MADIDALLKENQAYQYIVAAKTKLSEAQALLKLALDENTPGNQDLMQHYKEDVMMAFMDTVGAKLHL